MTSPRKLIALTILLATSAASAAPPSPIDAARIKSDVAALSADAMLGRGPGEEGETRAVAWLSAAFARAGLEPAGDEGGWTQAVPLVRIDRAPGSRFALTYAGRTTELAIGGDATIGLRNVGRTDIVSAPLVFAGYGAVEKARGWDPYEGVDMRGKVAVLLANDPDFEAGRDLGFNGRALAYAGRSGVKFSAAAAAGALGVIVIHDDAGYSFPFSQWANGVQLPTMATQPLATSPLAFSSNISPARGAQLLRSAGLTLARAKRAAQNRSFRAMPMNGATVSIAGETRATPFLSHNVVGRLRGTSHPDEAILFGAHWDANGNNGPNARGDAIRNGAIDNATGTSEMIEVARAFAAGPRPQRTVIFAAWTAEEKGLLGSDWYAGHHGRSNPDTIAVINLDPHVMLPTTRNIELIGVGRTTLEDDLRAAALRQGLRVDAEPNPEAGWYFRSDHFPFAQRGVPAIAFRAGRDLAKGGKRAGNAIVERYNRKCYHQPCDEFSPAWTFAAAAQEAAVAWDLGRALANSRSRPGWTGDPRFAGERAPAK
jgi:Zn-dependent M28 family amino/carboxypeptidase